MGDDCRAERGRYPAVCQTSECKADLAYSMQPLCLAFGQNIFFDMDAYTKTANERYLRFFDRYLEEA